MTLRDPDDRWVFTDECRRAADDCAYFLDAPLSYVRSFCGTFFGTFYGVPFSSPHAWVTPALFRMISIPMYRDSPSVPHLNDVAEQLATHARRRTSSVYSFLISTPISPDRWGKNDDIYHIFIFFCFFIGENKRPHFALELSEIPDAPRCAKCLV